MSKLFVDEIVHQSSQGSGTITIGASGETISIPSGATLTVPNGGLTGQNYPAFFAYANSAQSFTDVTTAKVQFDTEVFDTDNCYDNTTNYRFTPNVAGKYFVYVYTNGNTGTNTNMKRQYQVIRKNGSQIQLFNNDVRDSYGRLIPITSSYVVDMNGTTDYLEIFVFFNSSDGSNITLTSGSTEHSFFGAYRIGA